MQILVGGCIHDCVVVAKELKLSYPQYGYRVSEGVSLF